MSFFANAVGRKVLMSVSGALMLLFVVGHLLGNTSIFAGREAINAYAEHLHNLAPLVYFTRLLMGAALALHVFFGIIITIENSDANPSRYAVVKKLKATFASETMVWTGLLILAFVAYHLLQFTLRVTPDITPEAAAKKPGDVYAMVVTSFQHASIAGVYVAAMIALLLHLSHGIQSFPQTLGLSNENVQPKLVSLGKVLAGLFFLGFAAIPVSIILGILSK